MSTLCAVLVLTANFTIVDSVDIGDFANGVAFGNGYVWATENLVDQIFKIDPSNMQIVSTISYAGGLDGLGHDGTYLWLGYYPNAIHKIDTSGNVIGTWTSPGSYSYGMAYDGQDLWHSDQTTRNIYRLSYNDPSQILATFNVTWRPQDLEYFGGHLWAIGDNMTIYELDPTNMNVINTYPTERANSAGLAIGGGYLWFATNNRTGWVYKVSGIVGVQEPFVDKIPIGPWSVLVSPNPFRKATRLIVSGIQTAHQRLSLQIHDVSGRLVKSFDSGSSLITHRSLLIDWDGTNSIGRHVTPGVYFVRVEAGSAARTEKIVYLGQ